MKLSLRTLLVVLPLLAIGCSAGADEATDTTAGAASTSEGAEISIANFKTHPKITAIRNEVMKIEREELERSEKSGCDLDNTKYESDGDVRKVISEGKGTSTTIYYDDSKRVLFVFHKEGLVESRIYFEKSGDTLFQAIREQEDEDSRPVDRLPEDEEAVEDSTDYLDPDAWFNKSACEGE